MLNVTLTPHREFLPADSPAQKLFIMLKLRPTKEVANTRPSTTFTLMRQEGSRCTEGQR
jgi:Ca-activated chloride channel family protein